MNLHSTDLALGVKKIMQTQMRVVRSSRYERGDPHHFQLVVCVALIAIPNKILKVNTILDAKIKHLFVNSFKVSKTC